MAIKSEVRENLLILTMNNPKAEEQRHGEIREIFEDAKKHNVKAAIVDFTNLQEVDSICLGMLISGQIVLGPGCRIHLCGMTAHAANSIRTAGLNKVFRIHGDLKTALERYERRKQSRRNLERRGKDAMALINRRENNTRRLKKDRRRKSN